MKTLFTSLTLLTLNSFNLLAQWQADVRQTNDPGWSGDPSLSASGSFIHLVWNDFRDEHWGVYYKRSTDEGTSWEQDTLLTNDSTNTSAPVVSTLGLNVHIIWYDNRNGNWEIYYKSSTDGGISWGNDIRLTNDPNFSRDPFISASAQILSVVWKENRDGNWEIYYKSSTDDGISWGTDLRITDNPAESGEPSVSVSGMSVHVFWHDIRDGNWEIYHRHSTDGGVSWGSESRLTSQAGSSLSPNSALSGEGVEVVWYDNRDGNWEIYYKQSTNTGLSWLPDTRLTNYITSSTVPLIGASGSTKHIVWQDHRDGQFNWEIYYKLSTDGGINWGRDTRLTYDNADSWFPCIAISGSSVHIIWEDFRDGNFEIYYKRNPTGNPIGIINISSEIPKEFSLSQNFPNPFNPITKIKFDIPVAQISNLCIYDILGREVTTLVNEQLKPGTYEVEWDATKYPSGVYYYRLHVIDYLETKTMVLMK